MAFLPDGSLAAQRIEREDSGGPGGIATRRVSDEPSQGNSDGGMGPLGRAVETQPVDVRSWQVLPEGLIYRSYLAGAKESRFASQCVHDRHLGWIWDTALGGRAGLVRYGTEDPIHPEGWELDVEGAAFPRLDIDHDMDLMSSDFRVGVPLTYGVGRYQMKFGYYHICSHLGDEYMVRHDTLDRINYVRDALGWGHSLFLSEDLRVYAEAGWAFHTDGGAKPWEFQFGVDYSPFVPTRVYRGMPFVALNTNLRQDVDYHGNLVVQTGWQWRGDTGHLFRLGMQYYLGKSDQYEFFHQNEEKLGLGVWYDF